MLCRAWGFWVEKLAFLLVALYIILLLPRLKAGMAFAVSAALLIALIATHFVLMADMLMWIQLMASAVLLVIGHVLLTTKRFLGTERGKAKSDMESAESNRMLGLAFQGQGQLDMAFDKFKKVPLDDAVMDNMYNLALDFERKRQFNKAQAVYEYMATYNANFRDLDQKLNRAKQMSETVMLGGGGGRYQRQYPCAGGRNGGEAHARSLPGGKGTRQGSDGCRISRKGSEDWSGGCDQDHGTCQQEFEPDELEDVRAAVLPRSGNRRQTESPQYRHDLRCRRRA